MHPFCSSDKDWVKNLVVSYYLMNPFIELFTKRVINEERNGIEFTSFELQNIADKVRVNKLELFPAFLKKLIFKVHEEAEEI